MLQREGPWLAIGGRWRPAYRTLGEAGYGVAVLVAGGLAHRGGLSVAALTVLGLAGAAAAVGWVSAKRWLTGRERWVFQHAELAVFVTAGGLLWALRLPVLVYLDLVALGLVIVQAFGRVGCHLAGCCHGKPARRGVIYGHANVATGFPRELVEVRLAPVQLVEAAALVAVAVVVAVSIAVNAAPGSPLMIAVAATALVRVAVEFVRGDQRQTFLGLPIAQWWAALRLVLVGMAGHLGLLPANRALTITAGLLLLALGCTAVARTACLRWRPVANLALLRCLAHVLPRDDGTASDVVAHRTWAGWLVSASHVQHPCGTLHLYTLSGLHGRLEGAALRAAVSLVLRVRHPGLAARRWRLVHSGSAADHLLVLPDCACFSAAATPAATASARAAPVVSAFSESR